MKRDPVAEKWCAAWRHVAVTASGGWEVEIQDADVLAAPGPKAYLYMFDRLSGWTWMAAVSLQDFHRIAAEGRAMGAGERQAVCAGLADLAASVANRSVALDHDAMHRLAVLLSLYAGGTKTFQAANGFPDGAHFVAIVYREQGGGALLRPFAMAAAPGAPVAADVLAVSVGQVMQIDWERHPEWLKGDKKDE